MWIRGRMTCLAGIWMVTRAQLHHPRLNQRPETIAFVDWMAASGAEGGEG